MRRRIALVDQPAPIPLSVRVSPPSNDPLPTREMIVPHIEPNPIAYVRFQPGQIQVCPKCGKEFQRRTGLATHARWCGVPSKGRTWSKPERFTRIGPARGTNPPRESKHG